jgi:ArsR family transcriptional regulator
MRGEDVLENYTKGSKILKALGDPKRAMIVDMLSCGELCACKILEKFDMTQPTLSHHMKLLRECGLVSARDEGKWTYYSLNHNCIEKTKQFLSAITSNKEICICKQIIREENEHGANS